MRRASALFTMIFPALMAAACASAPSGPETLAPGDPAVGQQVAESLCASCHALGDSETSPNSAAPAFRHVLEGYRPEALAADLKQAATISHRNMPTFYMEDSHVDDLVAYLLTIQAS
ncbi:MAG: cytochrome c [Hyphomonadaceae bacterium]